ncbi:14142_t:CDS:2, partial [Cetraspora pellucida]
EDIEKAMQNLSRTSTAHIQLNCKNRKKSNIKTILGISNYLEWIWPIERPYTGFICSHLLLGFGKTNYISPIQIYKLLKSDIEQLQSEYSNHTTLKKNLNIFVDKNTPRDELMNVLKTNLCLNTLDNLKNNSTSMENIVTKNIDLMDIDETPNIILFSLPLGWALKHNQKYRKKGEKRLSKDVVEVLKRFFILGQANSSNRYTASDMHNGLLELVECEKINEKDVFTQ